MGIVQHLHIAPRRADVIELLANPGHLKVELSLKGLRLDAALRAQLVDEAASGGIDLLLPNDVWVQAPIDEHLTAHSPFTLAADAHGFRLRRADGGTDGAALEVRILAAPEFRRRSTARGTPMSDLAAVHGSFVAIDPAAAGCGFGGRRLALPG